MRFDAYGIIISLPVIVLALTVHEYAHALVADRLGDRTARQAGRLTLEPWAHLDPIGLLMIVFYRFGWARPVPVNPANMRHPVKGLAISAMAGPAANLIMSFLFALLLVGNVAGLAGPAVSGHLDGMISAGLMINARLVVFNLLPLPPLDGSRVAAWLLPVGRWPWWPTLETYGPLLLLLLLATGAGGYLIGVPATALIQGIYQLAFGLARLVGLG